MKKIIKEQVAEDYCFVCKDGGNMRICDYKDCLKCYHHKCEKKDRSFLTSDERWDCRWHQCFKCSKPAKFQCFTCPIAMCGRCVEAEEFIQVRGTKGFSSHCLRLAVLIETNSNEDILSANINEDHKVNFKKRGSYEKHFLQYYTEIKEKERLTPEMILEARDLFKEGKIFRTESDIEEFNPTEDIQMVSDYDASGDEMRAVKHTRKRKRVSRRPKVHMTRSLVNFANEGDERGEYPFAYLALDITEQINTDVEQQRPQEESPSTAFEGTEITLFQRRVETTGRGPEGSSRILEPLETEASITLAGLRSPSSNSMPNELREAEHIIQSTNSAPPNCDGLLALALQAELVRNCQATEGTPQPVQKNKYDMFADVEQLLSIDGSSSSRVLSLTGGISHDSKHDSSPVKDLENSKKLLQSFVELDFSTFVNVENRRCFLDALTTLSQSKDFSHQQTEAMHSLLNEFTSLTSSYMQAEDAKLVCQRLEKSNNSLEETMRHHLRMYEGASKREEVLDGQLQEINDYLRQLEQKRDAVNEEKDRVSSEKQKLASKVKEHKSQLLKSKENLAIWEKKRHQAHEEQKIVISAWESFRDLFCVESVNLGEKNAHRPEHVEQRLLEIFGEDPPDSSGPSNK